MLGTLLISLVSGSGKGGGALAPLISLPTFLSECAITVSNKGKMSSDVHLNKIRHQRSSKLIYIIKFNLIDSKEANNYPLVRNVRQKISS